MVRDLREASYLGLSLPFPSPGTPCPAFWHCIHALQLLTAAGTAERLRLWVCPLLNRCSFLTCLQPQSIIYSFSQSSPRNEGHGPSPPTSYPIIAKQINKVKSVAIQANTGDLVIVADTWYTGLRAEGKRRCCTPDTLPVCLLDFFGAHPLGFYSCVL